MGYEIVCKVCKRIIVEDSDKIDRNQEYLECPCGWRYNNPYYEGEK